MDSEPVIEGHVVRQFEPLAEAFAENFRADREIGASLCVMLEGEGVVDLWGGMADPEQGTKWHRDTLVPVFSNTKLATALVAHRLIDEGLLLPDIPVTRWWPEYASAPNAEANGKSTTNLHDILSHKAGLPALRQKLPEGAFLDHERMVHALEAEAPFWRPGTAHGYHMLTFGWLVSELVRRASGQSLDEAFRERFSEPLGLDLHMTLPEDEDARVAPILRSRIDRENPPAAFYARLFEDPGSLQGLAMLNTGRWDWNDPRYRRAEIGAAGAIGNARALAKLAAPLALDGANMLSAERVRALATPASSGPDRLLLVDTAFSEGAMLHMSNPAASKATKASHAERSGSDGPRSAAREMSFPIGPGAFGHVGMGGSFVFADPARRLSVAYVMNRLGEGLLVNARGLRLIEAINRLLPPHSATQ